MSAVVGRGLAAHMEAVGGSVCPDCGAVEGVEMPVGQEDVGRPGGQEDVEMPVGQEDVERPGGQEDVGACGCPGSQGQLKVEAMLPR